MVDDSVTEFIDDMSMRRDEIKQHCIIGFDQGPTAPSQTFLYEQGLMDEHEERSEQREMDEHEDSDV